MNLFKKKFKKKIIFKRKLRQDLKFCNKHVKNDFRLI